MKHAWHVGSSNSIFDNILYRGLIFNVQEDQSTFLLASFIFSRLCRSGNQLSWLHLVSALTLLLLSYNFTISRHFSDIYFCDLSYIYSTIEGVENSKLLEIVIRLLLSHLHLIPSLQPYLWYISLNYSTCISEGVKSLRWCKFVIISTHLFKDCLMHSPKYSSLHVLCRNT